MLVSQECAVPSWTGQIILMGRCTLVTKRWFVFMQVTVILAVCIGVGLLGIRRTSYPLWMAYVLLSIYPLAIALTAILDYAVGWNKL